MKKSSNSLIPKGSHFARRCIYCGAVLNGNATKDHVPPRFIFKDYNQVIKEQKITVPCCYKCNQAYSIVEQKLNPLFKLLRSNEVNANIIEGCIIEFNVLMKKIALGYMFHETSKYNLGNSQPNITYFFADNVSQKQINEFIGIGTDEFIEDISSNPKFPGLLLFEDDILLASIPTDITSEFWHEYNVNNNYVRMSFYWKLFVQVQF